MATAELISMIEAEWDLDNGFFGRLREGQFNPQFYARCANALDRIQTEVGNAENMSRRLVSLIWYIPLFMRWQTERVKESIGEIQFQRVVAEFETKVQGILGAP